MGGGTMAFHVSRRRRDAMFPGSEDAHGQRGGTNGSRRKVPAAQLKPPERKKRAEEQVREESWMRADAPTAALHPPSSLNARRTNMFKIHPSEEPLFTPSGPKMEQNPFC